MSCGYNRQDSACGLFGSTPCFEAGFVPVPLPINRPQYMYETNCGTTTYYGTGKPCCSAPNCGKGNCKPSYSQQCGRDAYRESYGDNIEPMKNIEKMKDIESDADYRHSIGYARIQRPPNCCNPTPPRCTLENTDKCGLSCKNRGGANLANCGFCSSY